MTERPHSKRVEINGTDIHYIERGHGEPVVFVHGGLSDLRTWIPQLEPFSQHYHAVAYSRRAHYPNDWDLNYANSSLAQHVDDLRGLIDFLHLGRVHIVANSYGGFIALYLAIHHPELIRTLSLAEPPVHPVLRRLPGGQEMYDSFFQKAWGPASHAFAHHHMTEGVRLFLDGAVGPGAFESMSVKAREGMMRNAPALRADALSDPALHMPEISCEDLSKIEAPTLLMRGELSPQMYRLINDELERCLPHAEQATIPSAAHILHNQNPAEHDRVVLAFLARHGES